MTPEPKTFAKLSDAERIEAIKTEFHDCIAQISVNPEEFKNNKTIAEDKFEAVNTYITGLRPADCNCGECIDTDKLSGRIPDELKPVLLLARKRCEEKTY